MEATSRHLEGTNLMLFLWGGGQQKVLFGQENRRVALMDGHRLSLERCTLRKAWRLNEDHFQNSSVSRQRLKQVPCCPWLLFYIKDMENFSRQDHWNKSSVTNGLDNGSCPPVVTGDEMPTGVTNELKGLSRAIHLDAERHLPKIAFWSDHSAKWFTEKRGAGGGGRTMYETAESFWQTTAFGNAEHSILIKKSLGANWHL